MRNIVSKPYESIHKPLYPFHKDMQNDTNCLPFIGSYDFLSLKSDISTSSPSFLLNSGV